MKFRKRHPTWLLNSAPKAATTVNPPSSLIATGISNSEIDLSWQDNASNEDGYKIERSSDGVAGWSQIGTAGVNATTYQDTGLGSSETWYYRVRAYKGALNSTYSNTAFGSTNKGSGPIDTYFSDGDPQDDQGAPWLGAIDSTTSPGNFSGYTCTLIDDFWALTSALAASLLGLTSGHTVQFGGKQNTGRSLTVPITSVISDPGSAWPDNDLCLLFFAGGISLSDQIVPVEFSGTDESTYPNGTLMADIDWVFCPDLTIDTGCVASVLSRIDNSLVGVAPRGITLTNNMISMVNSGAGNYGYFGSGLMAYDGSSNYVVGIAVSPADVIQTQASIYTRISQYQDWLTSTTGLSPHG